MTHGQTYQTAFEPIVSRGHLVRLEPEGEIRRVRQVEPLQDVGPLTFGSATGGGTVGSGDEQYVSELEMANNELGHYRVFPLHDLRIEVRQTGQQNQRFQNLNVTGKITPTTPENHAEIYVQGDNAPYFVIENPTPRDYAQTVIGVKGIRYQLEPGEVPPGQAEREDPVSIAVDKLERRTQQGGSA